MYGIYKGINHLNKRVIFGNIKIEYGNYDI